MNDGTRQQTNEKGWRRTPDNNLEKGWRRTPDNNLEKGWRRTPDNNLIGEDGDPQS